jgi:hypothetical protein
MEFGDVIKLSESFAFEAEYPAVRVVYLGGTCGVCIVPGTGWVKGRVEATLAMEVWVKVEGWPNAPAATS